jgi:hypothetical protein
MNACIRILGLLLIAPALAQAQSADSVVRGQGYVFLFPLWQVQLTSRRATDLIPVLVETC